MKKKLIIVESDSKGKTINQYLGGEYLVVASAGHIRQIPSKPNQVTYTDKFHFNWETDTKKTERIMKAIPYCSEILLATDPDREGEAISWHINNFLNEKKIKLNVGRVCFFEITKNAIIDALKNVRKIDQNLVDACIARTGLDYKVGFTLSPLLYTKLKLKNASIGRVQTPSLRLIAEREYEILSFKKQKYYQILGVFDKNKIKYDAKLTKIEDKAFKQTFDKEECDNIFKSLQGPFVINKITKKKMSSSPSAPLITSTLQQISSSVLGYNPTKTMQIAQKLYEGVDFDGQRKGLITYMRTDSTNMSKEAISKIRDYLSKNYSDYLPEKPNTYDKKVKNAQEAHECIRPTDITITPQSLENKIDNELLNVYKLIWKRALASQMTKSVSEIISFNIKGENCEFSFSNSFLLDEGYGILDGKVKEQTKIVLKEKDEIDLTDKKITEHETSPPDRYTEASLIMKLEEIGIGRPSSYASIMEVLFKREYVEKKGRSMMLTPKGELVSIFSTDFLSKYVDYNFTATMEEFLDDIANGKQDMNNYLKNFIDGLETDATDLSKIKGPDYFSKISNQIKLIQKQKCSKCENEMTIRYGYDMYFYCTHCQLSVPLCDNKKESKEENGNKDGTYLNKTKTCFVLKKGEKIVFLALKYEKFLNENPESYDDLLEIPKILGIENNEEISIGSNKYGVFVKHGKKYVNFDIKDIASIDLQKAKELLHLK